MNSTLRLIIKCGLMLIASESPYAFASDMGTPGLLFGLTFMFGFAYSGSIYLVAGLIFILPKRPKSPRQKRIAYSIPGIIVGITALTIYQPKLFEQVSFKITSGALVAMILTTISYYALLHKRGNFQQE